MDKIRYTPDGKKVLLQDTINQNEYIVQEIIIIDGKEAPNGVSFITKILYDKPVETWQEKNIKKIKENYKKESDKYDDDIKILKRDFRKVSNELRLKINYISSAVDKISPETFNLLADYITGEIRYIVLIDYTPKIIPINEFNQMYEDKLRLISLFGKDDGSFTYAVGDYYDWSGGNKKFIPCKYYDEATKVLQNYIETKETYSEDIIKTLRKHKLPLNKEKLKEYKQNAKDSILKNIEKYKIKIKKWESDIKDVKSL